MSASTFIQLKRNAQDIEHPGEKLFIESHLKSKYGPLGFCCLMLRGLFRASMSIILNSREKFIRYNWILQIAGWLIHIKRVDDSPLDGRCECVLRYLQNLSSAFFAFSNMVVSSKLFKLHANYVGLKWICCWNLPRTKVWEFFKLQEWRKFVLQELFVPTQLSLNQQTWIKSFQ